VKAVALRSPETLANVTGGLVRYGAAVGMTVAAAAVQKVLWPSLTPSPLLFFYPAVLVVARVAGLGPALLSVVLSIPFLVHWFLPPYGTLHVERPVDLLNVVVWVVLAACVAVLVDRVKRSEQRARAAIEAAPIPTVVLADDGEIIFANSAFVGSIGRPARELRNVRVTRLAHPEDGAAVERALSEMRDRRRFDLTPASFEARFLASGGRTMQAAVTLSATVNRDKGRYVLQLVDVTERHAAEIERERALTTLRTFVEQCPEGIVFVEEGGRIALCNSIARSLFGGDPASTSETVPGLRDVDGHALPDDATPSARALRGERISGLELVYRRPDGTEVPLLLNAAPLPALDGRDEAAVIVFQDISTLKELEQLRVQWSAVIAHDLRQPLHSIMLRTQMLAQRARAANVSTDELDAITRTTQHLDAMVQDLLDASRLEARHLELRRRGIDLGALVSERVRDAESAAPMRRFEVEIRDTQLHVWADPERLIQILDNLLGNAIKYGRASCPIRIEVGLTAGMGAVAVTSEGEPIPREELPHLFERFRRADSAVRRGIQGIGLGLYIVRELVVAHGGEIVCESDPGGRTTFRFTVPLVQSAERRTGA
jgi:PAS domain S-box-containing protein